MRIPEFNIDTDDIIPGSAYFSWGEALYLHQWNRFATSADGLNGKIIISIQNFAVNFLKPIRTMAAVPFIVHCWYRPPQYSVLVGGTSSDVHTATRAFDKDSVACAVDFHPTYSEDPVKGCQILKAKLLPVLEKFQIRMENNGALAGWVHLDNLPPIAPLYHRLFNA